MNEQVIDIHIHIGGPGGERDDDQSGCQWSREFELTEAYWAILFTTGTFPWNLTQKRITKKLLKILKKSKIDNGVLLALDKVYDLDGKSYGVNDDSPIKSHLVVPNKYIARLKSENPNKVLFGASIHPYRNKKDLEEEFQFCLRNGAVLCKWIPSAQMIDPREKKCETLYYLLREHKIPLLYHTGPEPTVPTSYRNIPEYKNNPYEFNNPKYLQYPLEKGVTVIAAHCSVPYYGIFDPDYKMYLKEFINIFKKAKENGWKWNLYADVSALCSPFISKEIIETIQNNVPSERLLFGSDFPVPISQLSYSKKKPDLWTLIKLHFENPLNRNKEMIIDRMKFKKEILTNAYWLFKELGRIE
ncbi:MAG: amidohydrolase family protein [Candidatus Aminicenantia bacterium]